MHKYMILFPIPNPQRNDLEVFMDLVAGYTELSPPYKTQLPHVTFHRPITGIKEKVLINLTRSIALQQRATRMSVSALYPFGKQHMVLPVHTTLAMAKIWVGVNQLLTALPEYEHGEFDHDNTLHITVARKTSEVFDKVWPIVAKRCTYYHMTAPVTKVELHKKRVTLHRLSVTDAPWQKVAEFKLPE